MMSSSGSIDDQFEAVISQPRRGGEWSETEDHMNDSGNTTGDILASKFAKRLKIGQNLMIVSPPHLVTEAPPPHSIKRIGVCPHLVVPDPTSPSSKSVKNTYPTVGQVVSACVTTPL